MMDAKGLIFDSELFSSYLKTPDEGLVYDLLHDYDLVRQLYFEISRQGLFCHIIFLKDEKSDLDLAKKKTSDLRKYFKQIQSCSGFCDDIKNEKSFSERLMIGKKEVCLCSNKTLKGVNASF